jgi:NAD(P)-dependent dehydrogenase (short-subunit alcohol dehydrogenase family)
MIDTAVVIGGSRGIGRACAAELGRRGAKTVVLGYAADEDAAAAAKAEVEATGASVQLVRADVATEAGVSSLVDTARAAGALDAVVYSAGYRALAPTLELDPARWQRALDVTLTGFVRTVQAMGPLVRSGGKMVGISGLSGLRAYSSMHLMMGTAKAASHHAMTYLAWELAQRGVNLNMVCCGSVHTEGVVRDLTPEQYETFVASAAGRIPGGRIAEPEHVARVVAFLCSRDADLIVGHVLVADGGETLR